VFEGLDVEMELEPEPAQRKSLNNKNLDSRISSSY
jgi:hypothetical protein